MGSYHAHAPWRKVVLIPFWTIQLLVGLLDLVLLAFAVAVIVRWNNDNCDDSFNCVDVSTEAKIIVPIWIVLLVVCLVLTITEIVLLARHKLKPKTFVVFNTIKSAVWTILFVIDIISFVDSNSRTTTFIGLIIEALLWLCFIIPLIYGSVVFHRTRHSTTYAPVVEPLANPSNLDLLPEYSIPTTYTGYSAKAYASTDVEAQAQPSTRVSGERRASYNHQRDTRFEAFRRTSYGNESYRPYAPESVGYRGTVPTGGRGSPEIQVPQVFVQHHDGETFEMESNSRTDLR